MEILKRIRKIRGEIKRTKSIESLEERAQNVDMRMFYEANAISVMEMQFIVERMDQLLTPPKNKLT